MDENGVTYSMRGRSVVISRPHHPDLVFDENSLKDSIAFVKNTRSMYVTEADWQHEVDVRENALKFAFPD